MSRTVKIILILNLLAATVLAFAYPHLMISPGKLIEGHRAQETDCFACHDLLFGAESGKCVACHKAADIGVMTTKGAPVVSKKTPVPFHQKLLEEDCVACHSDHVGVAKYRVRQRFSHGLLDNATLEQCVACHRNPADNFHKQVSETCTQCHGTESWKPAKFKHDMLPASEREQCATCHKAKTPDDNLHRQTSDRCGQCHTTEEWEPATFDHKKFFVFDGDHDVECKTCHRDDDYDRYTCYGCHEHSPEKVRSEHWEEGIRDYDICVACHRNADEDEAKRAWQSIKRGVPYRFGAPYERTGKNWKKRHHDDDDDDDD